jgi:hypothetical protein
MNTKGNTRAKVKELNSLTPFYKFIRQRKIK